MKSAAIGVMVALAISLTGLGHSVVAAVPVPSKEDKQISGEPLPHAGLLDRGVRRYLRYRVSGEVWAPIDIVVREIREANVDGRDRLTITAKYFATASPNQSPTSETHSVVDAMTFVPISHQRRRTRDGVLTTESYLFSQDGLVSDPDVTDSTNVDFALSLTEPTYNFELDLELLEALNWSEGASRVVNFYHPGGSTAPADYTFVVAGTEDLAGYGGVNIPCWVVTTDYNRPGTPPTKFWISKEGQAVLRVEQAFPDGSAIVKQLIGETSAQ